MKYFVISDVHNHFTEMMTALNEKGFDRNNSNHKLILVGDVFDRGNEAVDVYNYLKDLVINDKLIWIAGNHEFFILKRFKERFFTRHGDTYNTFLQIASNYSNRADLTDGEVIRYCQAAGLEDFIKNNIRAYFETENYVFVHGAIPSHKSEYNDNWRELPIMSWSMPSMRNGMKSVMVDGIRVPGKTIVCGHSPAAYGNVRIGVDIADWDRREYNNLQRLKHDLSNSGIYKPFYGDGVIGIDANCYKTGFVNCIVIEEEDKDGK